MMTADRKLSTHVLTNLVSPANISNAPWSFYAGAPYSGNRGALAYYSFTCIQRSHASERIFPFSDASSALQIRTNRDKLGTKDFASRLRTSDVVTRS